MKELPMLLMGGSALLGSILSLVLPETLGSALPARWQYLMDEVSQLLEFAIPDSKGSLQIGKMENLRFCPN